jgi:hypothetical protein
MSSRSVEQASPYGGHRGRDSSQHCLQLRRHCFFYSVDPDELRDLLRIGFAFSFVAGPKRFDLPAACRDSFELLRKQPRHPARGQSRGEGETECRTLWACRLLTVNSWYPFVTASAGRRLQHQPNQHRAADFLCPHPGNAVQRKPGSIEHRMQRRSRHLQTAAPSAWRSGRSKNTAS